MFYNTFLKGSKFQSFEGNNFLHLLRRCIKRVLKVPTFCIYGNGALRERKTVPYDTFFLGEEGSKNSKNQNFGNFRVQKRCIKRLQNSVIRHFSGKPIIQKTEVLKNGIHENAALSNPKTVSYDPFLGGQNLENLKFRKNCIYEYAALSKRKKLSYDAFLDGPKTRTPMFRKIAFMKTLH